MENIKEMLETTNRNNYHNHFWNYMKRTGATSADLASNRDGFLLPNSSEKSFRKALEAKSVIRSLATKIVRYESDGKILVYDEDDQVDIVPENGAIPGFDSDNDFSDLWIRKYKIAGLFKVKTDFVKDCSFDIEEHIKNRMAKSFGKCEDRIFLKGNGESSPAGLLDRYIGAEVGVTTESLTYDDCIALFHSVKPEYRSNAVWLMNDNTALTLHKLKDNAGNYLWNSANDTILGRPVRICNEMPNIEAGYKPILFGDFDYYWIIDRSPITLKILTELFIESGRYGYVGSEFLDARLVRRDAIKAIIINGEVDENYVFQD